MTGRRLGPNSAVFVLLCCLGPLLGGCGKKGPPKAPQQERLPRAENFQAVVVDRGVRLTWTVGSDDDVPAGFNIYRSKAQPGIDDCTGCKRDFELFTTVRVKVGETSFQVLDESIEGKGSFYYKVTPFDKKSRAGPDSKEAAVFIE